MGNYYTIKGVKKGNEWQNSFGTFQSYSLSLEGMGEPVSINKAVPVKEEPEVGQKLYGTVEMQQSAKGTTYYKFKTEKVPDGEYTAPSPENAPTGSYEGHSDKEDSIARAVALKAATELLAAHGDVNSDVLGLAEVFLSWLKSENSGTSSAAEPTPKAATSNEEVSAPAAASGYDKAKAAANRLKQPEEPLPQEPEDLLGWIQDGAENDQD